MDEIGAHAREMTEVGEVAAWLRKQAEADIKAAAEATPGPWEFEGDDPTDDELFAAGEDSPAARFGDVVAYVRGGDRNVANGRHMERHDPRTEIARAESVLAVVAEYERHASAFGASVKAGRTVQGSIGVRLTVRTSGHDVRLLAFGYRRREGWRPEWA